MRRAVLVAAVLASLARPASAAEPFAEGLVTIAFDDGWQTQHSRALPLLEAYELDAVFFLTTLPLAEEWRGFMTLEQVRELQAAGHELQSHTVSHPDLVTLDAEGLDLELEASQAWLVETFGPGVGRHFAAPYGFYDDEVVAAVRRHYDSHRTVLNGRNWRDADPYTLASYDVHSRVSVEEVRTWLAETQAERSWIILTFHELVDGAPWRGTQLDVADFERILVAVRELGLRVVGMDEGVALMERAGSERDHDEGDGDEREVEEAGGCAASGGGGLAALALLAAATRRRRRALAFLALVLAACGEGGPRERGRDSPPDSRPDDGEPGLRLIGRFDTRVPEAPLAAWPGTRILARIVGERVAVELEEVVLPWQEHGPSELDVRIDGQWRDALRLEPGRRTYALVDGLGPGAHEVELYRRSEAQHGVTRLWGFDLGGGELLAPPARQPRRIEVIGDSASAGFGIEGVGLGPDCPGADSAARYQNFRLAWGARLGELLDAEVHGTVASGKGIVRNIWRDDTLTMPRIYDRANPFDPDSAYDLAATPPDVVLIMMGGNDFNIGFPYDDGPLAVPTFTAGLGELVGTLREAYPAADIVLVLSPSTPETVGGGRVLRESVRAGMTAVRDGRRADGDARVHFTEPGVATPDELLACNGHGTPEFHQRLAEELEIFVRELAGW